MLPAEASEELKQWLQKRMQDRGWSLRHTSIQAGLSHGRLSQIMNGDPPGIDVCVALAQLFDVQLELIMYLAGYPVRDPREVYDTEVARFADFLQQKPVPMRKKILRLIRSMLDLSDIAE